MAEPDVTSAEGVAADELKAFIERLSVRDLLAALDATEVWRPAPGLPGYFVSSWGHVRGPRRDVLRASVSRGYHHVCACVAGETVNVRIGRLVALAFLGEPPFADAQAAHNDGDKDNNRASNLRWATPAENAADIDRHGNRIKGSAVFGAVLREEDVPIVRQRAKSGERYADIAADYGVSISTISLIKLGKVWAHV